MKPSLSTAAETHSTAAMHVNCKKNCNKELFRFSARLRVFLGRLCRNKLDQGMVKNSDYLVAIMLSPVFSLLFWLDRRLRLSGLKINRSLAKYRFD